MKKKTKMGKMLKKMNGTSKLETKFAKILTDQGIRFEQHFNFKKREFDFLLVDYKILVETHGCFFHCCKIHNPEAKYEMQQKNLKNDQYKIKMVKFDPNYKLLIVWEHEIINTDEAVKKLNEFISNNKKTIEG